MVYDPSQPNEGIDELFVMPKDMGSIIDGITAVSIGPPVSPESVKYDGRLDNLIVAIIGGGGHTLERGPNQAESRTVSEEGLQLIFEHLQNRHGQLDLETIGRITREWAAKQGTN